MTNQIQAIETTYRGYRFRSRTEARWAVFFDTLGLKFEYEKEGFKLRSGWYLPDFWLPDVMGGSWFEVKGTSMTKEEELLAMQLSEATYKEVFVAVGSPDEGVANIVRFSEPYGMPYMFDGIKIVEDRTARGAVVIVDTNTNNEDLWCETSPGAVAKAIRAAKSARFESFSPSRSREMSERDLREMYTSGRR